METSEVIGGALFAMFVLGRVWFDRQRREQFSREFRTDPDYVCSPGGVLRGCELRTRDAELRGTLTPTGKKHLGWIATVAGIGLGERTTLTLGTGGLGGVLDAIGLKDVQTGDDAFDHAYTIRGSDHAVVRSVMRRPAVKAAVERLFTSDRWNFIKSCSLGKDGTLTVHVTRVERRSGEEMVAGVRGVQPGDRLNAGLSAAAGIFLNPREAREVFDKVRELATALHDARDSR